MLLVLFKIIVFNGLYNSHKIVILEGLYILLNEKYWKEITEEMNILIYMDCSLELCRERLTNRHMEKCTITKYIYHHLMYF